VAVSPGGVRGRSEGDFHSVKHGVLEREEELACAEDREGIEIYNRLPR